MGCTNVESVFEKTISVEEQEKKEKEWKEITDGIDWSKLGDNIKSFFGTDDQKPEGGSEDEKKDDEQKESADEKKEEKKTDEKEKKDKDKKEKDTKKEKDKKKEEPKKPKVENVKVDLTIEGSRNDVSSLDGSTFEAAKSKLEALAKADADRIAVEASLNELQGYSVDLVDKLEDNEFQAASTAEEREKLGGECAKVSDWLDEEAGVLTPVEEFQSKLKILKEMAAPVMARLREHRERPEALDVLKQSLNSSKVFLEKSREMVMPPKPKEDADEVKTEEKEEESKPEEVADDAAKEDGEKEADGEKKEKKATKEKKKSKKKSEIPDEGIFTSKELELLEKKIGEVEKWRDDKLEEQTAMPLSEMPKLTVSMIKSKIQDLDSEVQLLIGKARMIRAERERAKRKAEEEKKKEEEKAKKDKKKKKKEKDGDKEKKEKEETQEETTEAPVSDDVDSTDRENSSDEKPEPTDNENPDTTSNDKDTEEPSESDHTEL